MKDYLNLCNFLTDRYTAVNTNSNGAEPTTTTTSLRRQSRRCSSIVVNRFFSDNVHIEKRKRSKCGVCLMLSGVIAIAIASFTVIVDPYDVLFKWKVTFTPGGESFELWRKPPVGLYLRAYLFNVTNKDAFLRGEEKLHIQEVGPYVYREYLEHTNITFNDNGTITTIPKHPLVWIPERSNGSEDDILTLPNIALLSISNLVKDASYFTRVGLNVLIRQTDSHPLVEMTAKEFMFGYETTLTTLGNKLMPSWIHFDKIGLVERMYDFEDDTATIFTGETDIRLSGLFDTYRGSKNLPLWESHCGSIHMASDATKFPTLIKPNQTMSMYRKSICRAMPMVQTGEVVYGGLKAYNYTWKSGVLDNGAHDPQNKCFCRKGQCLKEGLIDVTDCYYGFPIALSYPHFYQADPSILEGVEGLNPTKENHETIFVIQPNSGLPLRLAVRFQINMAFGDLSPISRVGRFSNMVLPMMWTEIIMDNLPQDLENKYFFYLHTAPLLIQGLTYVLFICGPLFLIASVAQVFWKTWTNQRKSEKNETKKHMNYIYADSKSSIKAKEMDEYYSSLLLPQNNYLVREEKTANSCEENVV